MVGPPVWEVGTEHQSHVDRKTGQQNGPSPCVSAGQGPCLLVRDTGIEQDFTVTVKSVPHQRIGFLTCEYLRQYRVS